MSKSRPAWQPPHSMEAEKAVLGSMMINPEAAEVAVEQLEAGVFLHPAHQTVFGVLKSLVNLGMPLDFPSITTMLRDQRELDAVGGAAFISELTTFSPTAANVGSHIAVVQDKKQLRDLYQLCSETLITIRDGHPDLATLLGKMQAGLASLDPQSRGDHVLPAMVEKVTARLQRIKAGSVTRGQTTGIPWWEYFFGGLVEGCYYGLGARPGRGKSAMMEQMVGNLLNAEVGCCVFAQDMAPDVLLERMACRIAGVSKWDLDNGRLEKYEVELVEDTFGVLGRSKLRLHCVERVTGEMLIAIARREYRKHGIRHFFLDHVQTIHVPSKEQRNEAWAHASQLVRQFVAAHGCSWVSLAHLNREAAKENVGAHQIRGFDDLLGDVDGLVLLDSSTDPSTLKHGEDWPMDFVVSKNRNGPEGRRDILFERTLMRFVIPPPRLPTL